ncbi:MAG: HAD-IB family phosphatase [Hyphomicrobiaceae bacterium]|jgi:2,3-diketo-5-methylthio-1-phosphopentane phosphatase
MSTSNVSSTRAQCHVFVDFDGTIVPCDATDFLFERFALPEWRDVERDWQAGKIGSRECMTRQVDLLRATPEQLFGAVSELRVDPGFETFIRTCRRHGVGASIVSDGFDCVIAAVMRNAGFDLPFYANHLQPVGGDRWRLTFPFARGDCSALSGNCKCAVAKDSGAIIKVVVGDGRSDFCVSGQADLVFAKEKLLQLCRENGTLHEPFTDFFQVAEKLGAWLRNTSRDRAAATPLAGQIAG